MGAAIGQENIGDVSMPEITSNFTDWMMGRAFCTMEEIKLSGQNRHGMMDKLKAAISNHVVRIIPKGVKGFDSPNTTNYLLLTNHKNALPLDDVDRRYAVIYSNYQKKSDLEPRSYYNELYAVLDDPDGIRQFLGSRDVSNFRRFDKPDLDDTKAMIENTKTEDQLIIEDVVEKLGNQISNAVLRVALEDAGFEYNNRRTPSIMQRIGYTRYRTDSERGWHR
jgi:hypothetical protein